MIPNEVEPTRFRATPAFTNQPTRSAPRPPGACRRLVLAVCPLLDLVSRWSDGDTHWECRLPPLELGVWKVSRVSLAGNALCPLATSPPGRWVGPRLALSIDTAPVLKLGMYQRVDLFDACVRRIKTSTIRRYDNSAINATVRTCAHTMMTESSVNGWGGPPFFIRMRSSRSDEDALVVVHRARLVTLQALE